MSIKFRPQFKGFIAVAALTLLGLSGCTGGIAARTMGWQEEVLLHDGQTAIAERHYQLGGYSTPASTDRTALSQTITFKVPGLKHRIVWETDFRDSVPEPNSLNLLLFDVVNGIPYIATYPAGCIAYNKWQRPNPPYVLFKHAQSRWQRISMAEFPAELTKTNVIVGRPATELLKSYYTVEGVDARNYYLEPQYKRILREALSDSELCPDWGAQRYRSPVPPLPIN
ncbi:hypothetical protein AT959_18830 [Dechloromonas denitrificans]|uniref:Lipoprotein n=1 Tax=Dechloromonas denitrificans TaxID=281362 RepID=A0A133XE76_9RHOO|nr:hypothetical protein [Dechloromonas denitrificans]KXB29239.1 hypothetical protein AT959_18830 [Dechloromonas denitrificans]